MGAVDPRHARGRLGHQQRRRARGGAAGGGRARGGPRGAVRCGARRPARRDAPPRGRPRSRHVAAKPTRGGRPERRRGSLHARGAPARPRRCVRRRIPAAHAGVRRAVGPRRGGGVAPRGRESGRGPRRPKWSRPPRPPRSDQRVSRDTLAAVLDTPHLPVVGIPWASRGGMGVAAGPRHAARPPPPRGPSSSSPAPRAHAADRLRAIRSTSRRRCGASPTPAPTLPSSCSTSAATDRCSGALLASDVVLTARRCISLVDGDSRAPPRARRSTGGLDLTGMRVLVGDDVGSAVERARGRAVLVPDGDVLCGADIALLLLDADHRRHRAARRAARPACRVGDHVRSVAFESGHKLVRDHVAVVATSSSRARAGARPRATRPRRPGDRRDERAGRRRPLPRRPELRRRRRLRRRHPRRRLLMLVQEALAEGHGRATPPTRPRRRRAQSTSAPRAPAEPTARPALRDYAGAAVLHAPVRPDRPLPQQEPVHGRPAELDRLRRMSSPSLACRGRR